MRRTAIIAALAGSLLVSLTALGAPQHRSTQKTPRKKEDPFLKGPAFQFPDLLRFVGNIFEGRLKDAVESRGIAFSPTASHIDQLKKAGASSSSSAHSQPRMNSAAVSAISTASP